MTADILTNIHNKLTTFSKGQRRIATYILESYDKAAFLTAGALGKLTGLLGSAGAVAVSTSCSTLHVPYTLDGEVELDAALREGRAMSTDAAIAYVFAELPVEHPSAPGRWT